MTKKRRNKSNKDENFGWRKQNKDRNLISDIIKDYTYMLHNNQRMKKII